MLYVRGMVVLRKSFQKKDVWTGWLAKSYGIARLRIDYSVAERWILYG